MKAEASTYIPAHVPSSNWTWVFTGLIGGVTLLMTLVLGSTLWGAATLTYTLTDQDLIIRYGYKQERIDRSSITSVTQVEPTRGSRLFGTGLTHLQTGWFSFAETGRIRLYSTSSRPLTVIETGENKWGISPADPDAFLKALAQGNTGRFEPVSGAFTMKNLGWLLLVAVPAGILVPIGLLVLLLHLQRGSRIISYTLDQEGLAIRVAWSLVRVPYQQIKSVEIASPSGSPFRTMGTALPGLYWGYFSWRQAGSHLRLYATRYKPMVLIRTAKATFGITPEGQDRFTDDLRARIETD